MTTHTRIAFYGDTTNNTNDTILLQFSQDGTNWYRGKEVNSKILVDISTTPPNFYDEKTITPPRVRFMRVNTSGAIETVNLYWTQL